MKISIKFLAITFSLAVTFGLTGLVRAAHPTVELGTAENFAILAGTGISDVPTSTVTGDVGVHPAAGSTITGLTCAGVTGTIYDVDGTFGGACEVEDEPLLNIAKQDLVTAYDDAAGRTPVTTVATELGGQTLVDGTYGSNSTTFTITAGSGPLVLDGGGNPDAVFIFQMNSGATGLVVGPGSEVELIGEAQACNVFWRLNTATIDTTAVFKGTILALTSITVADGADIEGRLLARNGSVSLDNDTITVPTTCVAGDSDDSDDDDDTSTTDSTPGFPNTGVSNKNSTDLWKAILPTGFTVSLAAFYIVRKKRATQHKL